MFIIRIYHDAWSSECQICANVCFITHWRFTFCSFTQYLSLKSYVLYKRYKPLNTHYRSGRIEHFCLEYLTRCQKAATYSVNQWWQYQLSQMISDLNTTFAMITELQIQRLCGVFMFVLVCTVLWPHRLCDGLILHPTIPAI